MRTYKGSFRFTGWLLLATSVLLFAACGKLKHNSPVITSAASTTFTEGTAGSFTVTATGYPASAFTMTGAPSWLTLNSQTGVLSGTPPTGSANTYPLVIKASNGTAPDASQNFTLTVVAASTAILIVHDGTTGTPEANIVSNLGSIVFSLGVSAQQSSGIPATSLSGFKEIWDVRFSTVLSAADIASYTTYVQGGGTLVMLGGPGPALGNDLRNNSIINNLIGPLGGGTLTIVTPGTATQSVLAPFNSPNSVVSVAFSGLGGSTISASSGALMTTDAANVGTAIFFDKNKLVHATSGRLMTVFDFGFLAAATVLPDAQSLIKNMIVLP